MKTSKRASVGVAVAVSLSFAGACYEPAEDDSIQTDGRVPVVATGDVSKSAMAADGAADILFAGDDAATNDQSEGDATGAPTTGESPVDETTDTEAPAGFGSTWSLDEIDAAFPEIEFVFENQSPYIAWVMLPFQKLDGLTNGYAPALRLREVDGSPAYAQFGEMRDWAVGCDSLCAKPRDEIPDCVNNTIVVSEWGDAFARSMWCGGATGTIAPFWVQRLGAAYGSRVYEVTEFFDGDVKIEYYCLEPQQAPSARSFEFELDVLVAEETQFADGDPFADEKCRERAPSFEQGSELTHGTWTLRARWDGPQQRTVRFVLPPEATP